MICNNNIIVAFSRGKEFVVPFFLFSYERHMDINEGRKPNNSRQFPVTTVQPSRCIINTVLPRLKRPHTIKLFISRTKQGDILYVDLIIRRAVLFFGQSQKVFWLSKISTNLSNNYIQSGYEAVENRSD